MKRLVSGVLAFAVLVPNALQTDPAYAQPALPDLPPARSDGWDQATQITALSAVGLQLLMPRIFYSDPEVTVGWKARWHVSVLAPSMTLAAITLFNEQVLKDEFAGHRPGCTEELQGLAGCTSYGMLSTQTFAAFSALGQGIGVFWVDSSKWSGGRFNFGSFLGNVAGPAILAVITGVGRTAGEWEGSGQVWATAGVSTAIGLGLGMLYASAQRPECGYTGNLICW